MLFFNEYSCVCPLTVSVIREGNWKLIYNFEDKSSELYNISEDIGEKNNLVNVYPELVNKMKEKLRKWQLQTGACIPNEIKKLSNN